MTNHQLQTASPAPHTCYRPRAYYTEASLLPTREKGRWPPAGAPGHARKGPMAPQRPLSRVESGAKPPGPESSRACLTGPGPPCPCACCLAEASLGRLSMFGVCAAHMVGALAQGTGDNVLCCPAMRGRNTAVVVMPDQPAFVLCRSRSAAYARKWGEVPYFPSRGKVPKADRGEAIRALPPGPPRAFFRLHEAAAFDGGSGCRGVL